MGRRRHDRWIEDFSYVLTRDAMRFERADPKYEVFAGSKPLGWLWVSFAAVLGGILGGTLVSGALWRSLLQIPLWLAAMVLVPFALRRATMAVSDAALRFLATWCLSWGLLIGVVAMWGGQLSHAGWAYGVAGVLGFLAGIVQGVYEPEDLEGHDAFFAVGMITAPLGACAAAWLYRNLLPQPATLVTAACCGAIAALTFLAPAMTVFLARLDNVDGLNRLGALLLHRDDTVAQAPPVFSAAIRLAPGNASLYARRALAHALAGDDVAARADWARHRELAPASAAPEIGQGWTHLRRGEVNEAAVAFEAALTGSKPATEAMIGLGIARMRAGDAAGAVTALGNFGARKHSALSLTHLAQALLEAGNPKAAERTATEAIDELDSIHARTWLVRAEARVALGKKKAAGRDFNKAWHIAEEEGIQDRALAGLDAIGRPLDEDEPE